MKGYSVEDFDNPDNDFNSSDQQKGISPPPLQKENMRSDALIIPLPEFSETILSESNIMHVIKRRRSRRRYKETPLSMQEISYLLWATQGVEGADQNREWMIRTVPSAGARHPYETYLIVNWVDDLEKSVYRYLPLTHELLFMSKKSDTREKVYFASYKEDFVADAPVCFVWSCIPYRGEWRYNSKAHKSMLLDAGHICQSLYLSAESINCGTCAIGGYHQQGFDNLLDLDGVDEFTVYLAAVGKVK
ncbi:MAG: SagB/ThcOx family dehydrogenase [Candidatus Hatepunaea meridiana]|nr:SagB/ThcOx family dehydrogenase [Candidatus Hatepunaea meridiana]